MKIKKGDTVIVITGTNKGKSGKIARNFPGTGKVIIDGVNVKKVHEKPRRSDQKGQIIERPAPIDISNVMVVDSKTKKPSRVGFRLEGKKKFKISKKSGATV